MPHIFRRGRLAGITAFIFLFPMASWGQIASFSSISTPFFEEDTSSAFILGLSTFMEFGQMKYAIKGDDDGGWKSELEWPSDATAYLGVTGSLRAAERLRFSAGVWKSVYDKQGTMKDSDWLYGHYGSQKAVYSESDTSLDGIRFDLNARYDVIRPNDTMALGVMLGYAYTQWEWEASNGKQWTIDPDEFYQGNISGVGITYQEKIGVPYAGIAFSSSIPYSLLDLNAYLLFSPFAYCEDEDDHLVRYKLSSGESDGTFWTFGGDLRWHIAPDWSVSFLANYTAYDLEGDQTQVFYDGEYAGQGAEGIDMALEGNQIYLGATASFGF